MSMSVVERVVLCMSPGLESWTFHDMFHNMFVCRAPKIDGVYDVFVHYDVDLYFLNCFHYSLFPFRDLRHVERFKLSKFRFLAFEFLPYDLEPLRSGHGRSPIFQMHETWRGSASG